MWQVTHLPRPPTLCYPHQSFHVGWGPKRSQPCQVSSKLVKRFWLPEESKSAFFLYLTMWLIQQVRATAQPVIRQCVHHRSVYKRDVQWKETFGFHKVYNRQNNSASAISFFRIHKYNEIYKCTSNQLKISLDISELTLFYTQCRCRHNGELLLKHVRYIWHCNGCKCYHP